MSELMNIEMQQRYNSIKERMEAAAYRGNRDLDEITLVAVSKTKPFDAIQTAIQLGMCDFGENKPQEIRDKVAFFKDALGVNANKIRWHMIGNIQKNKIKYILETCTLIHSVDSVEILEAINEAALKKQLTVSILLQVNVSLENSKNGFYVDELYALLSKLSMYKGVKIEGLMTIPPFVEDPEENRGHFRRLKEIFIDIKSKNIDNVYMKFLSMGMTDDFEVAIEEGATHVRVGTGIFGARNYNLIP